MNVVVVYARLYASCFQRALKGIGKSPWTLLLPMGLLLAFGVALGLASALPGILAGFAIALVMDALGSVYLYFVSEVVSNAKVSIKELGRSVGAYFWSVMNLLFVLWIADFVLGMALRGRSGGVILSAFWVVAAIVLNATPEAIYVRGTYGGLQTIQVSLEFLKENWIEWFLPNVPLLFGVWAAYTYLSAAFFGGLLGLVLPAVVTGALLHLVMVFRGNLFGELVGSSHRQRMFRYRNQ